MQIGLAENTLARECYGYGRWDAPYWFIGLEQGQGKKENDAVNPRYEVFLELGSDGLCDSAKFHNHPKIAEHWFQGKNPPTQSTWRYLILLLKAYLGEDTGLDSRRIYQRDRWGRSSIDGETCVVELRGMPANNVQVNRNRESYLNLRIAYIKERMQNPYPEFVVMYGKSAKEHWDTIAGVPLTLDVPKRCDNTTFLYARHPTDFFNKGEDKNAYYIALGKKLASVVKMS